MEYVIVKGHRFVQMERGMLVHTRIDIFMVKEHSLYLMERSNEVEFKYSKQ